MGEYVHPLKDMKNIKSTKPKLNRMRKNKIKLTESQLHKVIKESVKNVLNENVYDEDYEEIVPLYDIFKNGFTFDDYYREKILLDTTLCYKDGRELGVCLNDLCLKYYPNAK